MYVAGELVLDTAVYGFHQVDRLLGLSGGTARRWIDGYERSGQSYEPVIRREPTGVELVTWGEFVEAQLLAQYRSEGVPINRMRPVVMRLREELGIDYPLAWRKPFASMRELVFDMQVATELPGRLWIVERTGQLVLTPPAQGFYDQVSWHKSGYAERIHPLGHGHPVVFDPQRGFGEPVVGSIRTAIIAEQLRAGDSAEGLARDFGLTLDDIDAAATWEASVAA